MLSTAAKKNLINFGILFGIIFGMCTLLVTTTLLSRASWEKGLKTELQNVLDDYEDESFTVNKFIKLNSTFSTSTAIYSLTKDNGSNSNYYGFIIRIPSILGPMPAVFIYNPNTSDVKFVGYAIDLGKAIDTTNYKNANNVMSYWKKQIPIIFEKTDRTKAVSK